MSPPDAAPGAVLILHAGALGDFVLTLHAVTAITRGLEAAGGRPSIEVCARCDLSGMAVRCGLIARAVHPDSVGLHHLYAQGPIPSQLAEWPRGYALVVSFLGGGQAPVSQRLMEHAAGRVVCIDPMPGAGQEAVHIVEQWARQARAQGLPFELTEGGLFADRRQHLPAARDQIRKWLRRCHEEMLDGDRAGGPWIICHPGSGSPPKNCPLDPLERVLSWKKEQGWQAIWMIGPAEMERFASQPGGAPACLSRLRQTAPVLYCEETAAAAELLAAADQYIGNDAGMTHVAAAWGVPTLALFGPTEPKVWAPLGPRVGIVRFHGSESAGDIAVRVQDALKGDLALRNEA